VADFPYYCPGVQIYHISIDSHNLPFSRHSAGLDQRIKGSSHLQGVLDYQILKTEKLCQPSIRHSFDGEAIEAIEAIVRITKRVPEKIPWSFNCRYQITITKRVKSGFLYDVSKR